jgi:hypothetical protein
MLKKFLLAGLAASVVVLGPVRDLSVGPVAWAEGEEDPQAKELAKKLIAAGDKLMAEADKLRKKKRDSDAAAKYEKALKAYEEAYDRFPSAKIFYLIGLAELRLGRNLEAIRHFRQLLAEAEGVSDALRETVTLDIDEAKQQVVTLIFVVEPEGALISVDGVDVGQAPYTEPYFVAPGEHVIAVSAEGHVPFETRVALEAGAESERTIKLDRIPVVVDTPKPKPRPRPVPRRPRVSRTPLIAGISATAGLAALATVTGLIAVSKHGTFTDQTQPADEREAARDSGKTFALVTDLTWLATAAVGGYTAYYYYKVYKPRQRRLEQRGAAARVWVVPYADPAGGGVAVGGSF